MNGFDPSKFVEREAQGEGPAKPDPSPPVARNATRTLLQSSPTQPAENKQVWRAPKKFVAGVAVVAALDPDMLYAKNLNPMFEGPTPPIYTTSPWRRLCEGVAKFVRSGKAQRAIDHGWQPIELFGCYSRPWEVYSWPLGTVSLAFILDGRSVGHVDGSSIEILNKRGAHQRLYRAHHMTRRGSCSLMWEALDFRHWPDPDEEVIYRSN